MSKITFNNNNNNNNLFNVEKIQQRREPKKRNMLIKFDQKESWCELLNVSNISYNPRENMTWASSATPVF